MFASGSGEDGVLRLIKFRGEQTTRSVARHLGITEPGARKHLAALLDDGLVRFEDRTGKVGRPQRLWQLTDKAHRRFPDSHAVLTVEMLDQLRDLFGEDGLERLIDARERQMRHRYGASLSGLGDIGARVARLAEIRSEEGYMAEAVRMPDGQWLLAENHCPICAAANACRNFCRSELDLFRAVLGSGVEVERTDYILSGARRCAYRIRPSMESRS